jgi:poly-gamma-glutamate synthesis protein (capsule biosynthesis protein)
MGSIRISCIGDILPADTAYTMGNGIGSNMTKLIKYYSDNKNNPFCNSDIVFCNLEAPLIIKPNIVKQPFEGNPEVLRLMKILNISVVSIANNHMPDNGREGYDSTLNSLEDNGFTHIGSRQESRSQIAIITSKEKKIAFAAFNAINDHPGCNFIAPLNRDILFNTLHEIQKYSPDFIIFSFHWGNEYLTWPSPGQVDLAHELIDKGVTIIIGHHPHVVQPVENYHGGIIIYSLGNFLFDMFWSKNVRNGIRVDLDLNEDRSIEYQVKKFRIQPDFTQHYFNNSGALSYKKGRDKKWKLIQTGPRELYEKTYLHECKKQRLYARLHMKLYLFRNIFKLSRQSKEYLFSNIKLKSGSLWKKN